MRRVTEPPNCVGFNHRAKDDQKTINLLSHFHGLIPDTNYKHLECFIMLGTHFETHRCQMSHICDFSALSVKCIIVQMYRITYARIINVYINWFNNQKGLGWCPTKQNQANHLIYDILTTVLSFFVPSTFNFFFPAFVITTIFGEEIIQMSFHLNQYKTIVAHKKQ